MKYNSILLICVLLLFTTAVASAQNNKQSVKVRNFELVQERQQVTIDFTLEIGSKAAAGANTLSILPVLANGNNKKELTPVVVRGRKAEILYRRRFIASSRTADPEVITAKNGESLNYHAVLPYEEWMAGSTLILDGVDEGCCSAVRTYLGTVADNLMVPESNFTIEKQITIPGRHLTTGERLAEKFPFVKFADGSENYSREGITVYFHQDKNNIDLGYRRNRQSLIDILSVVEELRNSNDSEVDRIVIAGFASPEGGADHNYRLSERRAETVRQFIYDNSGLQRNRLNIYTGGEDWEGLRLLVAASYMPEKQQVLNIIDNTPIWDARGLRGREAELMRLNGGTTYRYLYRNFFPELREASYITIYFKNK